MLRGATAWLVVAVVVVASAAACPLELLTHNVKGSASEATQARYKEARGCSLATETEMNMGAYVERFRQWCCPAAAPPAQRRAAADTPAPADAEPEPEQDDDLNQVVEAVAFLPWNSDRIDQPLMPLDGGYHPPPLAAYANQKFGHVYILDSGLDPDHDVFADVATSLDYPSPAGARDCNGHGTRVASIIAGYITGVISRGADGVEATAKIVLHAVRALACDGTATVQEVINAISWILNNAQRPAFVSMSIGASKSPTFNAAVAALTNSGDFLVIVAAGNENTDACNTSPSSATGVVAVGATSTSDARASYSNWGTCLSIFAPGDNIYAAIAGSGNQIGPASGSSFSTPIVTALCARYQLEHPEVTSLQQVWLAVKGAATLNALSNIGPGSPNRMAYSRSAPAPSNPQPPPPPPNQPATTGPQPSSNGEERCVRTVVMEAYGLTLVATVLFILVL